MKKWEDIKRGLACDESCSACAYSDKNSEDREFHCWEAERDAIEFVALLIAETEAAILRANVLMERVQQLEAERDAVVKMLKAEIGCKSCAKYTGTEEYISTDCLDCLNDCNWEWRGIQKEERDD